MKLTCQKELFSIDEQTHYLNCAYKAPLLKSAESAAINDLIGQRTPSWMTPDDFFNVTEQVKSLFANLINSSASSIAIIPSTSYGFSSVLNNVDGKPGGHAITLKDEFPSGYFSLKRWCLENEQDLKIIEPDDDSESIGASWNDRILNSINDSTTVVLMSSIHWMNGTVFDLQAIGKKCQEIGAIFIVDETQSVGAMSMDVEAYRIDALVCATYKWMFGPYSIALAHIGEKFAGGKPLEESWMNRANARNFSSLTEYEESYAPGSGRYSVGQTSNFILMPMLRSALAQLTEWQPERIKDYCKELFEPLKNYLDSLHVKLDAEKYFSSHLFSLKLPEEIDTETLKKNLSNRNIHISLRGPYIRVSLNVFNDERDIRALIDSIEESRP